MSRQPLEGRSAADAAIALIRDGQQSRAVQLLEQAAAANDPRAQYLLGVALYNGDNVIADAARASRLLAAAAAAGIMQAQAALDDIGGSTRAADAEMLISERSAARIRAELARVERQSDTAPPTLEAMTRALLRPVLRERLESMLPVATHRAVEQVLRATSGAQARPDRS